MRSFGYTILLAFAAAFLSFVALWQFQQGNFDTIFGAPPTPVGQRLYDSFTPDEVKHIRISGVSGDATFSLTENGWQASSPWQDRMDPRAAMSIISFTLGMRVEDLAEAEKSDPAKSGLGDTAVQIRLEDAKRLPLANFKLGRVSPWKAEVEGVDQPVSTVFIHPRDRHHKKHVHLCTGDINPLFKDGLKFLRDHRPFYFNPVTLQKIRIRSQQGDLTLGRETSQSPWRIVKPLDLPTDPEAVKTLLEGLYELQSTRVSERTASASPTADSAVKPSQIAITSFGSEAETTLEIFPAETPDAHEVPATVSDRPSALFALPLKPEAGLVSLAGLPLAMNDLRDPVLTRLNISSLRAISIQPATGREILITREPPQPWMFDINGVSREANEGNLFSLLKAVTTSRAIGFESDAATDFTPWGLDRPILKLLFLNQDNQALELRFGMDRKGGLFVNRLGTPTVMRVDESLINSIAVQPYEWRHERLWSVNRVNLVGIERREGLNPPLVLRYHFIDESWQAERAGEDLSAAIDPARANFMLSVLEGLKVTRWFSPADEVVSTALANPTMVLTIIEKTIDDKGDFSGLMRRVLSLAPAAASYGGAYYGRVEGESHPFLIDGATYAKLAIGLLDE